MAEASVLNKSFCFVESLVEVLRFIHSKYRAEFFMSKLFAELYALNLANEDLSAFGYGYTGKFCNFCGRLTNYFSIKGAVDDDCLTNFFGLSRIQEVTTTGSKLSLNSVINAFKHDNRLLGSTNHSVIKGFGVDDGVYSQKNICRLVNDSWSVTCANT